MILNKKMFEADRDLSKLTPLMQKRVEIFLKKCKDAGLDIFVTEGYRSKARQLYLWSFGRTLTPEMEKAYLGYDDPNITSHPEKKPVTQTLYSNHTKGMAIDIAFHGNEIYPKSMELWDKVYDIAESVGLSSLYRRTGYHDLPHIELLSEWQEEEPHWGTRFEDQLLEEGIIKDKKNLEEAPTRAELYKIASKILSRIRGKE